MRQLLALVAGLFVVVAMASPAAAEEHDVSIMDFAFDPATVTIAVGDIVTWYNDDDVSHTATSDAGSAQQWDSGTLEPDDDFSRTFNVPGSFPYHCTIHPNMKGTVVVQQVTTTTGAGATTTTTRPATTTTVAGATTTTTRAGVTGTTRIGGTTATPAPSVAATTGVANTGSSTGLELAMAGAAIGTGALLMYVGRRRRWGYSLWR